MNRRSQLECSPLPCAIVFPILSKEASHYAEVRMKVKTEIFFWDGNPLQPVSH